MLNSSPRFHPTHPAVPFRIQVRAEPLLHPTTDSAHTPPPFVSRYVLEACELLPAESQMAARKLAEAQAMLKEKGIESSPVPHASGSSRGSGGASGVFDSFASFGFEDADSDGAGSDDGGVRRPGGSAFGLDSGFGGESGLGSFGGGGSALGTFDADFGDFDDAAEGFDTSFGDASPSPAKPPPPPRPAVPTPAAIAAFPRAPPPPAVVSGGGYGDSAALELGGGDGFGDFGDFDDAVTLQQPTCQQSSAAASGGRFAAFATPPPPPPPAPPSPPAAVPIPATLQPSSTLGGSAGAGHSCAVVAAGGSTGGGAGYAALEERLRVLEQRASAPPAGLAEVEARLERLSAQVERRLTGVKSGMKGLHERLQAVEVALAKLPGHLTKLKERQTTQARLGVEQAASLRRLEGTLPALSAAAAACAERMTELASLRGELERGDVALEDFALGDVDSLAEGGVGGARTGRQGGGLGGDPYSSSGAGALLPNGFGGGAVGPAMGETIPDTVGGASDAGGGLALAASAFGGFGGGGASILSAAIGGASGGAAPVPQEAGSQPGLSRRSDEASDGFGDFDDAPVPSAFSPSAAPTVETPAAAAARAESAAPLAAARSALAGSSPGVDTGGMRSTDIGGVDGADTGGVPRETGSAPDGGFGGFGEFEDGAPAAGAEAHVLGLAGGAGLRDPQPSPALVPPTVRSIQSHKDDFGAFDGENSPAAVGRADVTLWGGAGGLASSGVEEPSPTGGIGQAPAAAGLDFGSFGADEEASGGAGGSGAFPLQAAVWAGAVGGVERTVSDDEFNALFGVTE